MRVQVMLAHAPRDKRTGDPKGAAMKLHGYPCAGTAKINSHKDRVEGKQDATITVDGDQWDDWSDAEKMALLDHELQHFEVCLTKPKKRKRRGQPPTFIGGGEIILDDCHRPKMKMRLHDWELGGFEVIAERHGDDAFEVVAARKFKDKFGQLLFEFAAEPALAS